MGYEVHITRKEEWFAENGPLISEADWRAYVASDPELVITGVAEAQTPDGVLQLKEPLLTEWHAHSSGEIVWLYHFRGNFSIKNPDDECLAKMGRIAKALNARVQGDDGELYDGENRPASPPPAEPFLSRVRRRLTGLFKRERSMCSDIQLHFDVGDRVRDTWGNLHTVIAIQRVGTGIIYTRRDDGQEMGHAMFAHDLKRINTK